MADNAAELKRWRALDPARRAHGIRHDADMQILAVQLQHERIRSRATRPFDESNRRRDMILHAIDIDLFFTVLKRLVDVAERAAAVSDLQQVLSPQLAAFRKQAEGTPLAGRGNGPDGTIADLRHAFEHSGNRDRRDGMGIGSSPVGSTITYRNRLFLIADLFSAAIELHKAIRAAVDAEAAQFPNADVPIIEMA